jgi:hypothetical protein
MAVFQFFMTVSVIPANTASGRQASVSGGVNNAASESGASRLPSKQVHGAPRASTGHGHRDEVHVSHARIRRRDYFDAILTGLAGFPVNRVAQLVPTVWAQTRR